MAPFLREKAIRPTLLLGFVTAVPVLALLGLQWGFLRRFETATADVLKQASRDLAVEIAGRIQRDFKSATLNLLEQVGHGDVRELRLDSVADTLQKHARGVDFIDRFFVWSLSGASRPGTEPDVSVRFLTLRPGAPADPAARGPRLFLADPAVSPALVTSARQSAAGRRNFGFALHEHRGRPVHVVYHFMYDTADRGGLVAFVGFTVRLQHLADSYFPRVVMDATTRTRRLQGFPPLVAGILDERDRPVYPRDSRIFETYEASAFFPLFFFDVDLLDSLSPFRPSFQYWRVVTGFDGAPIAGIVRRQTVEQRALWFVVALIALAGVILTVHAAGRETRLARLKADFVSSVSHELKTPIAKILLFAETLLSGRARSAEKAQDYTRIIHRQAQKLDRLISGILDFAKIEAGVRRYEFEDHDLRLPLTRALATFEEELSRQQFRVDARVPDEEVRVLGNPEGLQQLFENLISNAIKYSDRDRLLRLELRALDGHVAVEVTDRGIGIPRREQRRIFRKFYRGHTASTGSGLGLAIVEHVARAHGGKVSVRSTVGRGSTFVVQLPALCPAGTGDEADPRR